MKLLTVLFFFCACGTAKKDGSTGDTVRVKVDESFEIKLGVSMGTGYSWSLADSAFTKFVSLDSTYTVPNPSGKEDGPETQVFRFKAVSSGETILRFVHGRPWKKEEKPDKEKSYQVFVE